MTISKEDQIAIAEDEIRGLERLKYRLSIRARVRKAIGDSEVVEQIAGEMERTELMLDEHLKILEELGRG